MPLDWFQLTDLLLGPTHLSPGPASFPIISIVKVARKRMLLEVSTLLKDTGGFQLILLKRTPKMLLKHFKQL